MTIEPQISPNEETCWRCTDLGLPGTIPAGEEYFRFFDGAKERNCCADCFARLQEECEP